MVQPPDIEQNLDEGISDFWISGQSLIKENCDNSRTSDDIDMKLGPVVKLDKKRQKNLTVTSCQQTVIIIFLIYDQFGAIQKLNSRRIVYKTYIFINSDLLSYKN